MSFRRALICVICYCPREGYKVASHIRRDGALAGHVTVPVRGIRLHPDGLVVADGPVAGYCPREGYKVASSRRMRLSARALLLSP